MNRVAIRDCFFLDQRECFIKRLAGEHTSELQSLTKQKTAYRLVSDWSSDVRSEEHTSELQSLTNLVCRLLLEIGRATSELQSLTNLACPLLLAILSHNLLNRRSPQLRH